MPCFHYSILVLCIFLGACSDQPQGNPYFPLQKGLSWTYKVTTAYSNRSTQDQLIITSLGKQDVGNKTYYVRRTSSGIDYYLNFNEQGIFREGLRTLVELKPRLDPEKRFVLKFPLQPGTNWREISQPLILLRVFPYQERVGESAQVPMNYQVESVDAQVKVPFGTFENCIKVIAEGEFEIFTDAVNGFVKIPIRMEEWYASGIGLVKQVRHELDGDTLKISDTPVFLGGNTRLELESFTN